MLGKTIILAGLMMMTSSPALAAVAVSNSTYTPEIESTKPLTDLLQNNKFKTLYQASYYAKDDNVNISDNDAVIPLQLAEWHYGYSDYGLYFYVWNRPQYTGFDLFSSLNGVTLQDLASGSFYLYPIKYISSTENQFYKFKIDIPSLTLYDYLTDEGYRNYSLGQLHLKNKVSANGLATAYTYGKKYVYSGSLAADDLEMFETETEVLSVNATGGTYRTTSADVGLDTPGKMYDASMSHNDLHYVYFNVPNSLLNQYGQVAEYHFTYHPILLNPIVTLQGSQVTNSSIQQTSDPNDYGENYYAIYQWLKANDRNFVHNQWKDYGFIPYRYDSEVSEFMDIFIFIITAGVYSARHIEHLGNEANKVDAFRTVCIDSTFNAIPLNEETDSVSSAQMDNLINLDTLPQWASLYFDGKVYETFEDLWNASLVEEHLRYDQEDYILYSYDRNNHSKAVNTWRDRNNGYPVGEDVTIHPIEAITHSNVNTDLEDWFLEDDEDMIAAFHNNYTNATATGKTPYIFRFWHSQSIIESLFYEGIGNENDFWHYNTICTKNRAGSIFQGYGIYDLISLDLTFEKEGQETIIPIVADPININPKIDAGVDVVKETVDIWAIVKKILIAAAIFVGIVFALWLLLKIIGWTRKAFKD